VHLKTLALPVSTHSTKSNASWPRGLGVLRLGSLYPKCQTVVSVPLTSTSCVLDPALSSANKIPMIFLYLRVTPAYILAEFREKVITYTEKWIYMCYSTRENVCQLTTEQQLGCARSNTRLTFMKFWTPWFIILITLVFAVSAKEVLGTYFKVAYAQFLCQILKPANLKFPVILTRYTMFQL
jgi:hypothetical protein